jgi:nicotinate-nucleotide adenylyltransferase
VKRVGILGGTFDPIHLGHLILASFAADELSLDEVVFMPAQTPPHKRGMHVSAVEHRVAMVELAIATDPRFDLSRLDVLGNQPSYTADLLERFDDTVPYAEPVFLIGADSLRAFPTWYRPDRILELARLGVARRPGSVIDDRMLSAIPRLRERTTVFSSPLIDISSTEIRRRIAVGKSISWLVPAEVKSYIHGHGLYLPTSHDATLQTSS